MVPDEPRSSSERGCPEEGDGEPSLSTRSVHAGTGADPATGARATPIYQTTSYAFEDADRAAALYAEGDLYSRISNPTVRALEERLAEQGDDVMDPTDLLADLERAIERATEEVAT